MKPRLNKSHARVLAYTLPFIATVASLIILARFADARRLENAYNLKLQLAFFTAFLTVGSFLMAMKSFILVRLKDDVYNHSRYRQRYLDQNSNEYKGHYYKGLRDLGNLLSISVLWAFGASIAQISLGFVACLWAKAAAIALGIGLLVIVLIDWWFVYRNLMCWFAFIEEDKKLDMEQAAEI